MELYRMYAQNNYSCIDHYAPKVTYQQVIAKVAALGALRMDNMVNDFSVQIRIVSDKEKYIQVSTGQHEVLSLSNIELSSSAGPIKPLSIFQRSTALTTYAEVGSENYLRSLEKMEHVIKDFYENPYGVLSQKDILRTMLTIIDEIKYIVKLRKIGKECSDRQRNFQQ